MNEKDLIMPLSVKLEFLCSGEAVWGIPTFLLVLLARIEGASEITNDELNELDIAPDNIAGNSSIKEEQQHIHFLQKTIPWEKLIPYISCPPYLLNEFKQMWTEKRTEQGEFAFQFRITSFPEMIYRYIAYHPEYIRDLFVNGNLFMPCPAMFNACLSD